MFCRQLHGIHDAQNFVEVASGAHRIAQHQFDFLVRPDHENRTNGRIVRCCTSFARFARFRRKHVVKLRDLELRIADHRVVHLVALRFFDVPGPLRVAAHRVHAQPDNFHVSLLEFRLQPGHVAELGRTDRREIFRVRKQNRPAVANPFMEVDDTSRCFRCEVRC